LERGILIRGYRVLVCLGVMLGVIYFEYLCTSLIIDLRHARDNA
jgi:hypothetical protein